MKQRLLTPGPTPVPEETLLELARPAFYHRGPTFRKLLAEVTADLRHLFCTQQPVCTLTASGTGGMEAALASSFAPGSKILCVTAGRWGERWRNIAKALGLEVVSISAPYGKVVPPAQLLAALDQHSDTQGVCATLCETATGVKADIASYGEIIAKTPALFLVDSISGLGSVECRTDEWRIDLNVTGSQKALMLPPGLAFVSVSEKAWAKMDATPTRAFYFDLKKYRESLKTHDTPFTPANSLVRALRVSLAKLRSIGIENLWARYAAIARAARAGIEAMNLELFAEVPAESMTVVRIPETIDGAQLLSTLEEKHGIKLAGGQDSLKGKIFRLAHMGYIDAFDVLAALSALELTLLELGWPLESGASVAAAQRVFAESVVPQSIGVR
jgi:aspartate aminotransferase-like enzyme